MVDGHAYRGDLHTLHGSDIDQIEVITNPSAQYSAEGTGGIINILLRRNRADGVTGNASLEASSLGSISANGTIKVKRGKATFEFSPEFQSGVWQRSTYDKRRTVEPQSPSPIRNSEQGGGQFRSTGGGANAKLSYDVDERTSLSAAFYGGENAWSSDNRSDVTGLSPGFTSYSQSLRNHGRANFFAVSLSADHKGRRDGESLKLSSNLFGNPRTQNIVDVAVSDGSGFVSDRREPSLFWQNKVDWQHPMGKSQILSVGGEFLLQRLNPRYLFEAKGNDGLPVMVTDEYQGRQSTFAAYATFQQKFGSWSAMPGLRLEATNRRVISPGQPDVSVRHTNLFPTFHVEHPMGKSWTMTLSYSRRIDRPRLDQLRPYPVQQDPLSIAFGNPALRDESSGAYEFNLHYRRKKIEAGLIIYDRETNDLIRTIYSVDDEGRNVSMPINVGHKSDRGAELDINAPLIKRIKGNLSVNLFQSHEPIDFSTGEQDTRFRFTSNLTLEYDGSEKHGRSGDVAQFTWHYESPTTSFQTRNRPWHMLSLSYTHNLDRALALTLTAESGTLGDGHRLVAPEVLEDYRVHRRPALKIKLVKSFGKR